MRTSKFTIPICIGRKSSFEMAHILTKAVTKECNATVHGHSYEWSVHITALPDAETGMVIDYSILKDIMCATEDVFDHATVIPSRRIVERTLSSCSLHECFGEKILVSQADPTAEFLCLVLGKEIYERVTNIHGMTQRLHSVIVNLKETANTTAMIEMNSLSYEFSKNSPVGLRYLDEKENVFGQYQDEEEIGG
jgi:6-pyruvoyl tetrahydropterin synthase/QueD family protein